MTRKILTRVSPFGFAQGRLTTSIWLGGSVFRNLLILAIFTSIGASCRAQTLAVKSPGKATPVAQKRYCQQGGGFCFSYPANWLMLGESMGDGVVVAPQQTLDRPLWDEVTVAAVVPSA